MDVSSSTLVLQTENAANTHGATTFAKSNVQNIVTAKRKYGMPIMNDPRRVNRLYSSCLDNDSKIGEMSSSKEMLTKQRMDRLHVTQVVTPQTNYRLEPNQVINSSKIENSIEDDEKDRSVKNHHETVEQMKRIQETNDLLKKKIKELESQFAREKEEMKKIHFENMTRCMKQHEQKRLDDMDRLTHTISMNEKNVSKEKLQDLEKCCDELRQLNQQNEIERADLITKLKSKSNHAERLIELREKCKHLEKLLKIQRKKYDTDMKIVKESHLRSLTKMRHQYDDEKSCIQNHVSTLELNNKKLLEHESSTKSAQTKEIEALKTQLHLESERAANAEQILHVLQSEKAALINEVNQMRSTIGEITLLKEQERQSAQSINADLNKKNSQISNYIISNKLIK